MHGSRDQGGEYPYTPRERDIKVRPFMKSMGWGNPTDFFIYWLKNMETRSYRRFEESVHAHKLVDLIWKNSEENEDVRNMFVEKASIILVQDIEKIKNNQNSQHQVLRCIMFSIRCLIPLL